MGDDDLLGAHALMVGNVLESGCAARRR
jgi:hypothetical protein